MATHQGQLLGQCQLLNPTRQLQSRYIHHHADKIETKAKCNCAHVTTEIATPFHAQASPVFRVFLNGYDVVTNTVVQLSASPTNLQGTTLSIKITVGPRTILKRAWLSWLAFIPTQASFGSYGGQLAESNFMGANSKDISNSLFYSPYRFLGLNLLSLTNDGAIEFSSNVDDDFVLSVSSSVVCNHFSLVYVVVGVPTASACLNCGSNMVLSGKECVSACPPGTFSFTYKDGGVGCRSCSSKLGLILSGGKCVKGKTTVTTTTTTTTINTSGSGSTSTVGMGSTGATGSTSTTSTTSKKPAPKPYPYPKPTPKPVPVEPVVSKDCAEHAFWNGHECVC